MIEPRHFEHLTATIARHGHAIHYVHGGRDGEGGGGAGEGGCVHTRGEGPGAGPFAGLRSGPGPGFRPVSGRGGGLGLGAGAGGGPGRRPVAGLASRPAPGAMRCGEAGTDLAAPPACRLDPYGECGPPYAYTIGLAGWLGRDYELAVVGPEPALAAAILNGVAARLILDGLDPYPGLELAGSLPGQAEGQPEGPESAVTFVRVREPRELPVIQAYYPVPPPVWQILLPEQRSRGAAQPRL